LSATLLSALAGLLLLLTGALSATALLTATLLTTLPGLLLLLTGTGILLVGLLVGVGHCLVLLEVAWNSAPRPLDKTQGPREGFRPGKTKCAQRQPNSPGN